MGLVIGIVIGIATGKANSYRVLISSGFLLHSYRVPNIFLWGPSWDTAARELGSYRNTWISVGFLMYSYGGLAGTPLAESCPRLAGELPQSWGSPDTGIF